MRALLRLVPVLLVLAACSAQPQKGAVRRDTLTRRQRDSITANSQLPGSKAVGRALDASDAAAAHNAAIDSLSR